MEKIKKMLRLENPIEAFLIFDYCEFEEIKKFAKVFHVTESEFLEEKEKRAFSDSTVLQWLIIKKLKERKSHERTR